MSHQHLLARQALEQADKPRSIHEIRRTNKNNEMDKSEESGIQDDVNVSHHPTSPTELLMSSELESAVNIVCHWRSVSCGKSKEIIFGEHFMRSSSIQKKKGLKCPFSITGKYIKKISHDFDSYAQLVFDLEVTIRNQDFLSEQILFMFDLDQVDDLQFIGTESFKCNLSGGEDLVVPLKVALTKGGIFNIQAICLTIFSDQDDFTSGSVFRFDQQWNVEINV